MNIEQRRLQVIHRLMIVGIVTVTGLGLLPAMPVAAYEPVAPWQVAQGTLYLSSTGRFAIAFPSPPKVVTEEDDIDGDPIQLHLFESTTTTTQYMVAYADLPSAFLSQGAETVLDQLQDYTFAENTLEALVESEVEVQVSGHPGRRYRYSDDDGTIDMRLYLVDERAYLLMAVDSDATDVDRFISSFSLR